MYYAFDDQIAAMNQQYELFPIPDGGMKKRLIQFYKIISDEVQETEAIIAEAEEIEGNITSADVVRIKTGLADLLADIVVYCASEATRWGIPLANVLEIVMASNFSKLGEDGRPIKNPETGKFLKGPNYWKPEPKIAELLQVRGRETLETPNSAELKEVAARLTASIPAEVVHSALADDANPQAVRHP